jgi:hypothetical protein
MASLNIRSVSASGTRRDTYKVLCPVPLCRENAQRDNTGQRPPCPVMSRASRP